MTWVLERDLEPLTQFELDVIVEQIRSLNRSIARLEQASQEASQKLKGYRNLTSIKGALEGMEQKDVFGAVNIMRQDDHQLLNRYYEAVLTKGQKYDVEKTGLGWKTEAKTTVADETLPTTCKMKRPES